MTSIEAAVQLVQDSPDDFIVINDGEFEIHELTSVLNERGFHAIVIDRAPVFDRETLMHALYQSLRFPGYFGFTWDSLKDLLTTIDGERGRGFVLAFADLSLIGDADRNELLDVVDDANEIRERHEHLKKIRILTLKN